MLNTYNVSTIKQNVQYNVAFIFDLLSVKCVSFVRWWLSLKKKILSILEKPLVVFENKASCVCATVWKYYTS